jgi:hypothetical protein
VAFGLVLMSWQKRSSVGFTTAADVVHELIDTRDEKRSLRLQRQLAGYTLLVIDVRLRAAIASPVPRASIPRTGRDRHDPCECHSGKTPEGPQGRLRLSSLVQFYSGAPMHVLSGVDSLLLRVVDAYSPDFWATCWWASQSIMNPLSKANGVANPAQTSPRYSKSPISGRRLAQLWGI